MELIPPSKISMLSRIRFVQGGREQIFSSLKKIHLVCSLTLGNNRDKKIKDLIFFYQTNVFINNYSNIFLKRTQT